MHKLVKYMKPYIVNIIMIVILLFVQANADLALPGYMSDIVDIGISNSGIVDEVPRVISTDTYNSMIMVSDENEKDVIQKSYEKGKASEIEIIERTESFNNNEDVYILSSFGKTNSKDLKTIIEKNVIEKISPETAGLTSSMKEKANAFFIKSEYENLNINVDSIQMKYLLSTGLRMLGVAFAGMIATVIVVMLASRTAAGLGRDLRNKTFDKVLKFSNYEIDKFSIASLVNRSTNDIQQIQLFLVMFLRLIFYAPILGIGGLIKVSSTNVSMVWIIGVSLISITIIMLTIFGLAVPRFNLIQKFLDKIALVSRESLTGLLVIRAFNKEKFQEEKFDKANKDLTKTTMFVGRLMGMMMPTLMFIMNCTTILIVWYGSHQIDFGNLEIGDMMAFIQYSMQIIMAFLMISIVSVMLPRSSVAAKRIDEILSTELSINDISDSESFDSSLKGYIEFKNVSFRYPDAEEDVLSNIDFKAKSGDKIAIIGGTGSGKSTIVKLINRFYDVSDGSILIDGVDIRNVKQSELRERVGYVPQKSFLFSGDIESNIKFSNLEMSDDDMVYAANISQSSEFINQKENKYSSTISEGGSNVSGGQRQRLSIARAIAKKPEIIIFDDSFSALDFKTESKLKKALSNEMNYITKVIVAQRISTIKDSDLILVLDEGKVVGKGTHSDLLENCEVYKEIALSQLSKEELGYE